MGKSSKRKQSEKPSSASGAMGFASSNHLAASVYAAKNAGNEISKEDLAYLKYHMKHAGGVPPNQSAVGARLRIKSNAPTQKKLNSLIQGVLTEFAQPNPYP